MSAQLSTIKRLPRRRRHFASLSEADLRSVVSHTIGAQADSAEIIMPHQGINNMTYFARNRGGDNFVIKVRPGLKREPDAPPPPKRRVNSPQWPRYTQELLGPYPNGDLDTLPGIAALLRQHGRVRLPRIFRVDDTLELIPAAYIVTEWLEGTSFDWHDFTPQAARQLGEHLGGVHAATGNKGGFGIFASNAEFPAEHWWLRFAKAYRILAAELARGSETMRSLGDTLERALTQAVATGTPQRCGLICIDQNPQHYLRGEEGTIAAMVDIEGHLWAPIEYELAMVEMWVQHPANLRAGYEQVTAWPAALEQARPAYQFMTFMEWIYCVYTLLHKPEEAAELEQVLAQQCANWSRVVHPVAANAAGQE